MWQSQQEVVNGANPVHTRPTMTNTCLPSPGCPPPSPSTTSTTPSTERMPLLLLPHHNLASSPVWIRDWGWSPQLEGRCDHHRDQGHDQQHEHKKVVDVEDLYPTPPSRQTWKMAQCSLPCLYKIAALLEEQQ